MHKRKNNSLHGPVVHPFLQEAAKNTSSLAYQIFACPFLGKQQRLNLRRLPRSQRYHADAYRSATYLACIPQRIKACEAFISKQPSSYYLGRVGFGQKDFIRDHYYAYTILLKSSYDLALQLIRSVFNLGNLPIENRSKAQFEIWFQRPHVKRELIRIAKLTLPARVSFCRCSDFKLGLNGEISQDAEISFYLRFAHVVATPDVFCSQTRREVDSIAPAEVSALIVHMSEQRTNLASSNRVNIRSIQCNCCRF